MPASPFDPLERMEPGEDRFVIREKDPAGPEAITGWAQLRRNWAFKTYGIEPTGDAKRLLDAELAQCNEAEEKALAWREAQTGGGAIEGVKATYSAATLSEEQVAAAKRAKHLSELSRHLREAAYHACEVIEGDGAGVDAALAEAHDRINELANAVEFGAKAKAA